MPPGTPRGPSKNRDRGPWTRTPAPRSCRAAQAPGAEDVRPVVWLWFPAPSRPVPSMAVVGIDLGTTNSVVATVRGGQMVVIPDPQGRRLHPSVVSFLPDGQKLFSHE